VPIRIIWVLQFSDLVPKTSLEMCDKRYLNYQPDHPVNNGHIGTQLKVVHDLIELDIDMSESKQTQHVDLIQNITVSHEQTDKKWNIAQYVVHQISPHV
jgi:hypothetical protein